MAIQLVVFDIAGTTVKDRNNVAQTFQSVLLKNGFEAPLSVANRYMGYEKKHAIREIIEEVSPGTGVSDERVDTIHRDFVESMLHYYRTLETIEPLPHVEETLQALQAAGKKIAVNTGFSRDIADAIISRLGWKEKGWVNWIIASDEVAHGRPFPDMIRELMNKSGISDPQEVAKVGDTEVDIHEGRNAGCRYSIGITTGAYSRSELALHQPTHIIDDIREVIDLVNE